MSDSRISGFFRLTAAERIEELERRRWLTPADAASLKERLNLLSVRAADKMIENVIASFGLPLAVAPNFVVNGRECVVPLVVEEPSIVAALSASALLARPLGGFEAHCHESLAIGQVHLRDAGDAGAAMAAIAAARESLVDAANAVHPRLVERGGGVREIEARSLTHDDGRCTLAVHLLVDTCDAMGANLVNTICESIAPMLAEICSANVAMCILSNLNQRSLVTASARYRLGDLADDEAAAVRARDAIVLANDIACADPYRAATHNKGIMNGIDPLAIATGNDWRAIEAGAHAYAASDGRYTSLTRWSVNADGDLEGEITLPLKVGVVGGTLDANRGAAIGLRICGCATARELAELMAAVGLAQNFAALRALVTTGIQRGHMRLHARSVAARIGVPDEYFDEIVTGLVTSGNVKDWKARELLRKKQAGEKSGSGCSAAGKVILLGEHAAVYGRHALALPIPNAVVASAKVSRRSTISIPAWGVRVDIHGGDKPGEAVSLIARELGVADREFEIDVKTILPRAMGLGSSAALAVALIRALAAASGIEVSDERVNAIAFECEKLAHGTPSGVDNTIATYSEPMLFRRRDALEIETLELSAPPPIVIASSGTPGSTLEQVAGVRLRREADAARYDAIFDQLDELTLAAAGALRAADFAKLGRLLNIGHGLLNAIEVSTPELERMIAIARGAGALGAKLTGAGGGGSILALCPGRVDDIVQRLEAEGFSTISLQALRERQIG